MARVLIKKKATFLETDLLKKKKKKKTAFKKQIFCISNLNT